MNEWTDDTKMTDYFMVFNEQMNKQKNNAKSRFIFAIQSNQQQELQCIDVNIFQNGGVFV